MECYGIIECGDLEDAIIGFWENKHYFTTQVPTRLRAARAHTFQKRESKPLIITCEVKSYRLVITVRTLCGLPRSPDVGAQLPKLLVYIPRNIWHLRRPVHGG